MVFGKSMKFFRLGLLLCLLVTVTVSLSGCKWAPGAQVAKQVVKVSAKQATKQSVKAVAKVGAKTKVARLFNKKTVARSANAEAGYSTRKIYQTYTKTNPKTGDIYCGKTSGCGLPKDNVIKRDSNHHMNKEGYDPAVLDKSSKNSSAIRGREQELIDFHGGAKSQGGTSGNKINSISDKNPKKEFYQNENKKKFGQKDD